MWNFQCRDVRWQNPRWCVFKHWESGYGALARDVPHKELDSNQINFWMPVYFRILLTHPHVKILSDFVVLLELNGHPVIHHTHLRPQRVTRRCTTQSTKPQKYFDATWEVLACFGSVATDISAIFICWVSFDVLESCRILQLRGGICAHQSPVRWCWPCRDAHIDPVALGDSASKSGLRFRERKSGCKGRSHHRVHQRYRYINRICTCENSVGWILPDLLSGSELYFLFET